MIDKVLETILCENCIHKNVCSKKEHLTNYMSEINDMSKEYDLLSGGIFYSVTYCKEYRYSPQILVRNNIPNTFNESEKNL